MKIFLKFADKAEFDAVFAPFKNMNDQGQLVAPAYMDVGAVHTAVDVIGVINRPTGNTLTASSGLEYPEVLPLAGFHVNLLGACPESLLPYVVTPASPSQDWA